MANIKTGLGFDIHRLIKGRKLWLGGVCIPYKKGLYGHSDADVLLHALCDAILGALGEPDIGEQFSDTDSQYKDISSVILLKKVVGLVRHLKFKICNIDCIIICDEPKLNVFRDEIISSIAGILSLDKKSVGIKAKTTEGILSFSGKGIAAYCVVLLEALSPKNKC